MIGWAGDMWIKFRGVDGQIFPPVMASYVAVKLYGPGHVVAYNYIADFHDGINVETYGNPDGSVASGPGIADGPKYPPREHWDRRPVAIDFYGNYITNSHDNPIEADGSMHNIRVLRNMFINHASHAFCNQPTLGGPVYWIRNIAYHLPAGSTRLTNGAAGVLFYNNTILSETVAAGTSNTHWRNNLILGENALPAIFNVTTFTQYTSSDYNGFRPNSGVAASFRWSAPPRGSGGRLQPPGPHGRARGARVRDARRVRARDGPGSQQRARRLRRLLERAEARRAGRRNGAKGLRHARPRLPPAARLRCHRPRHGARRRDGRIPRAARRISARSSSARLCPSTAHALEGAIMPSHRLGKSSVLAIAFIVVATPTWAHHGIGRFDPTRELDVEGTLTGLDFVNPHSYVHFNAVDANGVVIAMQCEMRAATVLRRSGWSPDMFVPGVAIKIHGRPHRDDPHYCYADTLTIGDAADAAALSAIER